jgi:PAS domain S-box-containing protein
MYKEGMFKELIESSDDIIIVTDREFRIRYISPSVSKSFGLEPPDLLGMNVFAFVDPDKIQDWKDCVYRNSGNSIKEEIYLEIKKGSKRYYDVHVSTMSTLDEPGLIVRLHDISEKKLREKDLVRSNKQLDQVIFKTTHDLQAPLKSALGLIKIAEQAPVDETTKYISLIKKSLHKLDFFIEEMNDFFRNEKLAIQREQINLLSMLNEEVANLKGLYEENHLTVTCEVHSSSAFFSDNIRLRTIVGNILSNAIKYSDPQKDQPFINITISTDEEVCEIRFSDNGIGIEEQYLRKIFDIFFRGTTKSEGSGLGLFIVKDTIDRLKGTIEVKSKLGFGSEFIIRLPNQVSRTVELA